MTFFSWPTSQVFLSGSGEIILISSGTGIKRKTTMSESPLITPPHETANLIQSQRASSEAPDSSGAQTHRSL